MIRTIQIGMVLMLISLTLSGCAEEKEKWSWNSMDVTATAYNSLASQTNALANVAAWGDTLRPGMKCIAVSRDLLKKGLTYNTPVIIEGFEGVYLVKDKMHKRWENRIDIYMGLDVEKAREWGRKKLTIQYGILNEDQK
ncbi:3D domain-containing protein [Muriicola sp. SD30]|uniref:3D domain-containing protein n=1 Tax=Muriicola sp. SD30 TaxID=3240936 RepID=UPI00350E9B81